MHIISLIFVTIPFKLCVYFVYVFFDANWLITNKRIHLSSEIIVNDNRMLIYIPL